MSTTFLALLAVAVVALLTVGYLLINPAKPAERDHSFQSYEEAEERSFRRPNFGNGGQVSRGEVVAYFEAVYDILELLLSRQARMEAKLDSGRRTAARVFTMLGAALLACIPILLNKYGLPT